MDKLDGLAIPMILGDWRLTILALEEKLATSLAIDMDSLEENDAADISEDIDRLEGIISYLKMMFEQEYGNKS
jgi:flagellin-specific chaperone FliS